MGTTLTGTTPQDTYDSLIKVTDNGPIGATAKYLSDGLGNDSKLALSTGNIGIGTATPAYNLHVNAASDSRIIITDSAQGSTANDGTYIRQSGVNSSIVNQENGTLQFGTNNSFVQTILANGNVGIGTSTPNALVEANGNIRSTRAGVSSQYIQVSGGDATGGTISLEGSAKTLVIKNNATSSSDVLFDQAVATRFTFAQAGTQILRIDADGVKFGTDSAAANALDDYEEGTFNFGISFGGGSTGITYNHRTGTYTKIGRQVTVNGLIALTNKGSDTGDARITGLPFTIPNSVGNYSVPALWFFDISFANQYQAYGVINNTTIFLNEITEAGTYSPLTNANFANTSEIMVSFTYFV
jgi:hypothetical protein